MYLYLGQSVLLPEEAVIGIFELDNTTWSFRTRRFLEGMEAAGRVVPVGDGLPRSFVLSQEGSAPPKVYFTQLTTATLQRRAEEDGFL